MDIRRIRHSRRFRACYLGFAVLIAAFFFHEAGKTLERRHAVGAEYVPCRLTSCETSTLPAITDTAVVSADPAEQTVPGDTGGNGDLISRLMTRVDAIMFRNRIHGPYAVSVHDELKAMVIDTSLMANGFPDLADVTRNAAVLAALPSHLPANGYISSRFGVRRSPFTGRQVHHNGIDFAVNYGSPVYATADGVVTYASRRRALGRAVIIDHGYSITTRYGHNSRVLVKVGDMVKRGDIIALSGNSGRSTGAHLHYEVRIAGQPVDPSLFMFDIPERLPQGGDHVLMAGSMEVPEFAIGGDGEEVTDFDPDRDAALVRLDSAIKASAWPRTIAVGLFLLSACALVLAAMPLRRHCRFQLV